MSDLKLKIAFMNYDRTRALLDGTIKIDGVDASFSSAEMVSDIFERMVRCKFTYMVADRTPYMVLPQT